MEKFVFPHGTEWYRLQFNYISLYRNSLFPLLKKILVLKETTKFFLLEHIFEGLYKVQAKHVFFRSHIITS